MKRTYSWWLSHNLERANFRGCEIANSMQLNRVGTKYGSGRNFRFCNSSHFAPKRRLEMFHLPGTIFRSKCTQSSPHSVFCKSMPCSVIRIMEHSLHYWFSTVSFGSGRQSRIRFGYHIKLRFNSSPVWLCSKVTPPCPIFTTRIEHLRSRLRIASVATRNEA